MTDLLLSSGYTVRILDSLSAQVHPHRRVPDYLNPRADIIVGDICDRVTVKRALSGVDAVIHLAAAVGVGQSMYEIVPYTETNELGTAVLLDALVRRPVRRLVCASSMSVYGEGLARGSDGGIVAPEERSMEQLRRGAWELQDERGRALDPLPTPESKPPSLSSVYALNKYNQERLCLIVGRAYGIPAVALRFFNVYGLRQALSNPYTGVLAIFASRLLNRRPPIIFEDGLQRRDFVHVRDVAQACLLALEKETGMAEVFNIGSGQSRTILSVAEDLAQATGETGLVPQPTGKYRAGDIRHCFADISKAAARLGYSPQIGFQDGLKELAVWLRDQVAEDAVEAATAELARRGLVA